MEVAIPQSLRLIVSKTQNCSHVKLTYQKEENKVLYVKGWQEMGQKVNSNSSLKCLNPPYYSELLLVLLLLLLLLKLLVVVVVVLLLAR